MRHYVATDFIRRRIWLGGELLYWDGGKEALAFDTGFDLLERITFRPRYDTIQYIPLNPSISETCSIDEYTQRRQMGKSCSGPDAATQA